MTGDLMKIVEVHDPRLLGDDSSEVYEVVAWVGTENEASDQFNSLRGAQRFAGTACDYFAAPVPCDQTTKTGDKRVIHAARWGSQDNQEAEEETCFLEDAREFIRARSMMRPAASALVESDDPREQDTETNIARIRIVEILKREARVSLNAARTKEGCAKEFKDYPPFANKERTEADYWRKQANEAERVAKVIGKNISLKWRISTWVQGHKVHVCDDCGCNFKIGRDLDALEWNAVQEWPCCPECVQRNLESAAEAMFWLEADRRTAAAEGC